MNSDPQKTDVDGGNQTIENTELSDAELSKVTGGSVGSAARAVFNELRGGLSDGVFTLASSMAGAAGGAQGGGGVSGAAGSVPKPD